MPEREKWTDPMTRKQRRTTKLKHKRGGEVVDAHPNSLEFKSWSDPELRRKLREGRVAQAMEAREWERWNRAGFTSGPSSRTSTRMGGMMFWEDETEKPVEEEDA